MPHNENVLCPVCHVGRLRLRSVTYAQVYYGLLVSVPNTPAWVCDVCHTVEYDRQSVQRIEALMEHAGPPHRRADRRSAERARTRLYPTDS